MRYEEKAAPREASVIAAPTEGLAVYVVNGFTAGAGTELVELGAKPVHSGCPIHTYERLPLLSEFNVIRPVKWRVSVGTANLLGTLAPIAKGDQGLTNAAVYC